MLTGLQLQNIALIDRLELEFQSGFTVLTGETGAGKSLLLDALDAVLGGAQGAAGQRLLREGSERSRIEASFRLTPLLKAWLSEADFDPEDELLVSREWKRQDGDRWSSRSRLNGTPVNRQQLLSLRPLLIDLTVQGQTQLLSKPGQQRQWLDHLGGSSLAALKADVAAAWQGWCESAAALEAVEREQQRCEEERAEQEALLEQLEAAGLEDPGEQEQLEQDQDRLVHGVRLQEGLAQLFRRFRDGADQAPSLQDHLAASVQELQAMAQLDGSLTGVKDQALDLEANVEELLRSLDHYSLALESDPEHLDRIQERLAELKRLQRRHGLDLAGLIDRRDGLRQRLGDGGFEADLQRLRLVEQSQRQQRDQANAALRQARSQAAIDLQASLLKLLPPMGLANVRFEVDLRPAEPADHGADAVSFLFSANPGSATGTVGGGGVWR